MQLSTYPALTEKLPFLPDHLTATYRCFRPFSEDLPGLLIKSLQLQEPAVFCMQLLLHGPIIAPYICLSQAPEIDCEPATFRVFTVSAGPGEGPVHVFLVQPENFTHLLFVHRYP